MVVPMFRRVHEGTQDVIYIVRGYLRHCIARFHSYHLFCPVPTPFTIHAVMDQRRGTLGRDAVDEVHMVTLVSIKWCSYSSIDIRPRPTGPC